MKASECLKKPGDVARRDTDGAIALLYRTVPHYKGGMSSIRMWWPATHSSGDNFTMREVDAMPGDWQPLGPITNLADLPRVHVPIDAPVSDDDGWTQESVPAIPESALTSRCLTRSEGEGDDKDSHEKGVLYDRIIRHLGIPYGVIDHVDKLKAERDTLTARVAELEGEVRHWKSNHDNQVRIKQESKARFDTRRVFELEHKLRAAVTELTSLRSKGGGELGEPLTEEEFNKLDRNSWILRHDGDRWHVARQKEFTGPFHNPHSRYWPWTPPTLPAPATEVPEVPKFVGCVKHNDGRIGFVSKVNSVDLQLVLSGDTEVRWWARTCCELYTHPNVPNSPELVAALEGAKP